MSLASRLPTSRTVQVILGLVPRLRLAYHAAGTMLKNDMCGGQLHSLDERLQL